MVFECDCDGRVWPEHEESCALHPRNLYLRRRQLEEDWLLELLGAR